MKSEKNKMPGKFFGALWIALSLLAVFPRITAYAEGERMLVPVGKTVGITAELGGVSVVNTAEFKNSSGESCSPAAEAGILPGDTIIKIDGREVSSAEELERLTDKSDGKEMTLLIERGGKPQEVHVTAAMNAEDEKYRLGVWIKDSASGIGTMTYYDPQSKEFGALGHGICDDEGRLIATRGGRVFDAEVASVRQGESGIPGELIGIFSDDKNELGRISSNSEVGVYGSAGGELLRTLPDKEVPAARRDEVAEGDVTVLSNVEGRNISEYSAKIVRINKDEAAAKGMVIEITDDRLLERTGGIVRGMSGSPILQNGKLVGAVTHVFVSDPTRGYAIFIENMLSKNE